MNLPLGHLAHAEVLVDEHGIWAVLIRHGLDDGSTVIIEDLPSLSAAMERVQRWCVARGYQLDTPITLTAFNADPTGPT